MPASHHWTVVQRISVFAIPIAVAIWLMSVPTLIGTSNLLVVIALFSALGWVAFTTYRNAMPASSLAQSLHDADRHRSDDRRQGRRRP
jgi:hypothetical protein